MLIEKVARNGISKRKISDQSYIKWEFLQTAGHSEVHLHDTKRPVVSNQDYEAKRVGKKAVIFIEHVFTTLNAFSLSSVRRI